MKRERAGKTAYSRQAVALFLAAVAVSAVWPRAASAVETLINTTTNLSQNYPAIAKDEAGNYVIVWHGEGQDTSGYGIIAQRFDSYGTPVGSEFVVNSYGSSDQGNSAVAMDDAGNFTVTWQSQGQDAGASWGIYAQRYQSTGLPDGSEFRVNSDIQQDQAMPAIAMNPQGGSVIVYQGYGSTDTYGIHARQYDASGNPAAASFLVHDPTAAVESAAAVAMDRDGNFVVVWERAGTDGDGLGVYGRRFDSTGAALDVEFLVNSTTASDQENPHIAMDRDGNFIVVWEDLGGDGDLEGIFAQAFDSSGTPSGGQFQVNTTTALDQRNPIVGMDPGGNFFILWESDGQDGDGLGIFGREFNYLGTPYGNDFQVNTTSSGIQAVGHNSIVGDAAGKWIAGWYGEGTGDMVGVFADTLHSTATADLQVSIDAGDPSPGEGDALSYTVTVTNGGPFVASGITLSQVLPPGVTFVGATPSDGTYDQVEETWQISSLGNGSGATLILDCLVDAGTAGDLITTTAEIVAVHEADPIQANNTDTASISVAAGDLALTKTVNEPAPAESATIVYTLTLGNNGPGDGTGIAVADTLPTGVTFVSSVPSQGTYDSGTGLWTVGSLADGLTATLEVTCTVDAGTAGSTILNTASISAATPPDPAPGNDTDSASITVAAADLQMAKTVDNLNPRAGEAIQYVLTVANAGPNDATGVAATDTLPAGLLVVSSVPSVGTYEPATGVWTIGDLPDGASATLEINCTVAAAAASTLLNIARVSGASPIDAMAANDVDSVSITVQAADLQLAKTVDRADPTEGETVVYTVTLTNAGPDAAAGVAVADTLPAGLTFVSGIASQGAYNQTTGIWTIGPLADGAFATLDITAAVDQGTGGASIINTARIAATDQGDPVPGNDTGLAALTVVALRGSIALVNLPPEADRINPGGAPKPALRFRVTNLAARPDTLRSLTVFNTSSGPGSPADLDNNWEEISLWVQSGDQLIEPPTAIETAATKGRFTAGQLSLADLSIPLPPGQDLLLVVQGKASVAARDGDVLSVAIPDSSALTFSLPADIQADWPLETVNALLVDGLTADQIALNEVAPGLFPQDSMRNLVLDFVVPPNGYSDDELARLNVVNLGNAVHGADITAVEGWVDDTDGTFDPGQDTPLGEFAFTGARWELTGLAQQIAATGLRVFVSVNIAADAGEGRSIRMALPALPDVGIGTASGNDGPLDRILANPYAQAISASNRVLISGWTIEPGTVNPGQLDVPLMHLVATNTYGDERSLGTVTITNGSSGAAAFASPELDGELAALSLRADGNGDGALGDLAVDTVLGSGRFRDGFLTISGLNWTLAPGATRHLFLTGAVSRDRASDGDVLSAFIGGGSAVGFATATAVSATWPLTSGARWSVDGMVADQIGNFPVPNQALAADEGPALALDVSIPANGIRDDTLIGLTLVNLGTAAGADLAGLELYLDGGDGLFTPGAGDDRELGPLVAVSGAWSSPILNEAIPAAGLRLFVGLTVAANPTDAATLQLAVPVGGITVASGNSGPLDRAIVSPGVCLLSTAPLLANLEFAVGQSTVGQEFTARMILRNVGGDNLVNITPSVPVVSGTGSAALIDGPVPTTVDLAVGAVDTLTWVYTATAAGTISLTAAAEGFTAGSAQIRASLAATAGDHRIFTPAAQLNVYSVTNMPFTLNRGQENVVPLTLTFLLPEGEPSSAVNLSRLRLRLKGSDGLGLVPTDLLNRVVVSEGIVTYLEKTDLESSGDEISLDLTTPLYVADGEPVSVAIRLDISGSTNVSDFLVSIEDPAWFSAADAVNGDPVATVLQGGAFPIESVIGAIVFEATGLEIGAVPQDDVSIGVGQQDVGLLSVELYNPGLSALGSNVLINALSCSLEDENGIVLEEPGLFLDTVRIAVGGEVLLTAAPAADAGGRFALELPSPLTIPVNTRVVLSVDGDLSQTAATGPVRLRLGDPASILARDGNSGAPVLSSYSPDEIVGPNLRIEGRAERLMARCEPLLPSTLVIGTHDAVAFSLDLRHPDAPDVAAIRVDSLRVACRNEHRQLISPSALIDKLELWADGVQVSVLHDPSGSGILTLPVAGLPIDPGRTVTMELRVDFEPGALPTSVELVLEGSGVFAHDLNLGTEVALVPEAGEEFPLTSGLTRLQVPAEELTIRFEDLMPAVLVGQGGEIPVARLTLANPAGLETSSITLESLTVHAAGEDFTARPIGSWLEETLLYLGDEIWGSVELDSTDEPVAILVPDEPAELNAGEVLELELRIRVRTEPVDAGLRLGIAEDAISIRQPDGVLSAVRIQPLDGAAFPFWTEIGNLTAAGLGESYSNFPNPFAAGREFTTFVIQLPGEATVSLRIMTAHWRPVATVLDRERRVAGLYQDDRWDGLNGEGVPVQNGVYVAELVVEFADGTRERHLRKVAVLR